MGLLIGLFCLRALGVRDAMMLGAASSIVLAIATGWMAYRSGFAARHAVVGTALFILMMEILLLGTTALAVDLAGRSTAAWPALAVVAATAALPLLWTAFCVRARLRAEGDDGPWVRSNLDPAAGAMRASALVAHAGDGTWMPGWLVGAVAVNSVALLRSTGASEFRLLSVGVALLAVATVWAGVGQVGPMLGKALFILGLERKTGLRYRHEHWPAIQVVRRSFWLSRLLMPRVEVPWTDGPARPGRR